LSWFRSAILPYLVFCAYWLITRSWRLTVVESPEMRAALNNKQPLIFAFWHGDELVTTSLSRFYRVATMTSTSKDGELLTKVLALMDIATSRGSSTRGGVRALKGLLELQKKEGRIPVVAVDGPRGPYHEVKAGVFQLSKLLNTPIVPVSFAAVRFHTFDKAWNKARLPLPFTRVVAYFGPPQLYTTAIDPRDAQIAHQLKQGLVAAEREAGKLIARP